MTPKETIINALNGLPDDVGYEECIDRIYVFSKIDRGLRDCEEGRLISHEDVIKRLKPWLSLGQ